jgi:hypothetical protein
VGFGGGAEIAVMVIDDLEIISFTCEYEESPAMFYRLFLVQCDSRQCLAFCARDGKWRNFEGGSQLQDFIRAIIAHHPQNEIAP